TGRLVFLLSPGAPFFAILTSRTITFSLAVRVVRAASAIQSSQYCGALNAADTCRALALAKMRSASLTRHAATSSGVRRLSSCLRGGLFLAASALASASVMPNTQNADMVWFLVMGGLTMPVCSRLPPYVLC